MSVSWLLLPVLLQTGCTSSEDPVNDDAAVFAAMDSVYQRFTRAYRLGEPDLVLGLYTDDPLYLPARGDIPAAGPRSSGSSSVF